MSLGAAVAHTRLQLLAQLLDEWRSSTLSQAAPSIHVPSTYCRPEIREGWASYDAKVDLFSLGVSGALLLSVCIVAGFGVCICACIDGSGHCLLDEPCGRSKRWDTC